MQLRLYFLVKNEACCTMLFVGVTICSCTNSLISKEQNSARRFTLRCQVSGKSLLVYLKPSARTTGILFCCSHCSNTCMFCEARSEPITLRCKVCIGILYMYNRPPLFF